MRVGLISDTHNLLRAEAREFLSGCDRIIHAGDICARAVLDELSVLAPVIAVRGNNDKGSWAKGLREAELVPLGAINLYVIHDLKELDIDLAAAGVHVIVSGHSHRPGVARRDGVLYVNPGSAGPRRFSLPISAAELLVDGSEISARIQQLVR